MSLCYCNLLRLLKLLPLFIERHSDFCLSESKRRSGSLLVVQVKIFLGECRDWGLVAPTVIRLIEQLSQIVERLIADVCIQ